MFGFVITIMYRVVQSVQFQLEGVHFNWRGCISTGGGAFQMEGVRFIWGGRRIDHFARPSLERVVFDCACIDYRTDDAVPNTAIGRSSLALARIMIDLAIYVDNFSEPCLVTNSH